MTSTDRDLIKRLADALEEIDAIDEAVAPHSTSRDPHPMLIEARAYLAQPEPEGPTDEEICKVLHQAICDFPPSHPAALDFDCRQYEIALQIREARAVLARYGHQPPAPIPLSERLPTEADCISNPRTDQGQWCWGWVQQHDEPPYSGRWRMMRREWLASEARAWLPHWALPVPQQEASS